jgi:hypothetical protein
MGVDLDGDAVLGAGPQHLLDVDLVARPALKVPPDHMAEDRRVRGCDGPQQSVRLGLPVQPEAAVDAATTKSKLSSTSSG